MVNCNSLKFLACLVTILLVAILMPRMGRPLGFMEDEIGKPAGLPIPDSDFSLFKVVIVTPGQRLSSIARAHQMPIKQLYQLNQGLASANYKPGDALVVSDTPDEIPQLPDLAEELARGIRGKKQIALTFDCGWVEHKDLKHLLAVLKDHDVQASFFLTGIFLKKHKKGVREIREAGYPVYNHSMSHPNFKTLTDEAVQTELLQLEERVNQQAPVTTRPFWRPPYGARDKRVLKAAAAAGYRSVYWTLDSHDTWTSPTLTPQYLFNRVCLEPYAKNPQDPDPLDGAIILFHGGAKSTPDALDSIIPYLKEKGYAFVNLPTLITP